MEIEKDLDTLRKEKVELEEKIQQMNGKAIKIRENTIKVIDTLKNVKDGIRDLIVKDLTFNVGDILYNKFIDSDGVFIVLIEIKEKIEEGKFLTINTGLNKIYKYGKYNKQIVCEICEFEIKAIRSDVAEIYNITQAQKEKLIADFEIKMLKINEEEIK